MRASSAQNMDAVWRVLRDLKQPVPDAEDGILGHCHGLPQGKPRRAHLCEPPGLTVWRGNYDHDVHEQSSDSANLPLLKIPSLSSPRTNANNWKTRFQTVENTFAACIEQICSAALDRRAIGCNEYADPEKQLPWLARQLERNTPKVQEKPAKDKKLFVFA